MTTTSRTLPVSVASLIAGLFWLVQPALGQHMPSRAFGEGVANPVHRFVAPDSATSDRLELGAAITALSTQAKRAAPEQDVSGLIRVSRVADLDTAHATLNWKQQKDGSQVARFEVRSEGAVGLRARLALPRSLGVSELRVGGNREDRVEWMRVTGLESELWTPYTVGDVQVIELHVRGNAAPVPGVSAGVMSLMHFDLSPLAPDLSATSVSGLAKEASGSCNVDVKCPSTRAGLDADIDQRKRSIAHLQFRVGSSGFVCTGTLINSDRFPRAFLLTANHCISTAAVAASLTTFWFYENTACGAADTGAQGRVQVAGGATMLQTNYMLDSTLLEVNAQVPNGTIFAGWDAADLADNTPVVSISHPRGDPMKYSEGSITETRARIAGYPVDMYGVTFTRGVIEGGSSGSGLFTQSPGNGLQLRGILSGTTIRQAGGMSCTNLNELALYGRFEAFYPNIRSIIQNSGPPADLDPSMPGLSVRPLSIGTQVNGSIDFAGDVDVFRIDVAQPGHLTIRSTGGNDLIGALLNSEGAGLIANDDAEASNNEFGFTYRITAPGTYYVSVAHWVPSTASGNYQLSARFTSATENYSSIWWNASESGWGLALNHQENIIAGALYTFDTDGQPQYLILTGASLTSANTYSGNLAKPSGPPYSTIPWPASQVQNPIVGTMQLSFVGTDNANLSYTIGGTQVTKALTRLTYATAPTCTFDGSDRSTSFNYQDIWWNPNESGWGLNIVHQGDILSVGLYTNDASGRNVWYLMAPGILQPGTSTYTGPLKRYTGPVFNAFPWGAVAETTVGTMSVSFNTGNQATLTYSVNGTSVVKQIQRFKFADIATRCTAPR
jgi:lysyl endopeptidase